MHQTPCGVTRVTKGTRHVQDFDRAGRIARDGSPASEHALAVACELLCGKEAAVLLFHVIPGPLIYGYGEPVVGEPYGPATAETEAGALLESHAQRLRSRGIGPLITQEVEIGEAAGLILGSAERDGVDLIVLGSGGRSTAERFMHGSVSTTVLTHAPCAVLVSHSGAPLPSGERAEDRAAMAV